MQDPKSILLMGDPGKAAVTQAIVEAVRRHVPRGRYRVFYFGSRVERRSTERSDIDVGLEADEKIPLDVMARLREELDEIPVLQKIDLVDFGCVTPEFAREAKRASEVIDER